MWHWLFNAFRKNNNSEQEFGPIVVQGRQLHCQVCGNGTFWAHNISLQNPFISLITLGFIDQTANCAICEQCGFVHWFVAPDIVSSPSKK